MVKPLLRRVKRFLIRHLQPPTQDGFPFPLPTLYWHHYSSIEPGVVLAVRDLCRNGDIAFDVGSWIGELTILMSRLVGPSGKVCAFEANPNVVPALTRNLAYNLCSNVWLTHRAIWNKTGETLTLYVPQGVNWESYGGLHATHHQQKELVRSLALDDFISETGLEPSLIKMDIEGAEPDALPGLVRFLESHRPHFVLEQTPKDFRCVEFLARYGYVAIDLNNYRIIRTASDYPPKSQLRNLVFLARDRLDDTPFPAEFSFGAPQTIPGSAFRASAPGIVAADIPVEPGRYACEIDFTCADPDRPLLLRAYDGGFLKINVQGACNHLYENSRDFILDAGSNGKVTVECRLLNPAPPVDLRVNSLRFSQVLNHRGSPASHFVAY